MEALDDIVNAITEILLVFEEAQSDFRTNLVVESKNLDFLVSEIEKLIVHNQGNAKEIKDQNIRSRLEQTNTEIANSSSRLHKLITSQPGGVIAREAYPLLHDELKSIMQNLVQQVQITDFVNVGIIMELCARNLDCIVRMKQVSSPESVKLSSSGALNGLVLISRESAKIALDLQIHLRTRMAEMTDQNYRNRLTNASEVFRTGAPVAITACQKAIEMPGNESKQERERALTVVVEALQEIVTVLHLSSSFVSTYSLLFPLPPQTARHPEPAPTPKKYEVQNANTYHRAPRVDAELGRLQDAVRRGDERDTSTAAKGFVEEAGKQVQVAKALSATKKDPRARDELAKLAQDLERVTPEVIAATKEALTKRNDKAAQQRFNDKVDEARQINARIEDAKKPEKQLIQINKDIDKTMRELSESAKNGNAALAAAAAKKLADQMKQQVALGRAFAETTKDPKRKQDILDACDELDRLLAQIAHATKQVLENPNDVEARNRLDALMDKARLEGGRLATAIIEEQLANNKDALNASLDNLYSAAKRGDAKETAEILKDITDQIQRRIELGRELASQTKDPELRRQILDACNDLEKLLPELVLATKDVLSNPNDERALKRLKDVIDDVKKASERITTTKKFGAPLSKSQVNLKQATPAKLGSGGDSTAEEIIFTAESLEQEFNRLLDAVRRGDPKEATAAAAEIAKFIKKQVELARKLAEETKDPVLKKKLLDAADKLESLVAPIIQATKEALLNPDDPNAQRKLENLLAQARAANKVISDAADIIRSNKTKINDITSNMSHKMNLVDNNSRSYAHDPKADSGNDKIKQAASHLKIATRGAVAPIPEQKQLVEIAQSIAAQMELLSLAAQQGNKKDMIAAARKIADMIQQVQKFSNEIATKCQDPVLKQQLLSICKVPKNFAVQLKIISAVKGTSGEEDPEAEAQLISCAQGVANSVVQTVKAAEAASLKCR